MEKYIRIAEVWANLLDSKFHFGPIKFGVGAILDLFPGGGDLVAALLSLYIVFLALKMHLPTSKIFRMLFNIGVDFVIGAIPIIGDIGYLVYKPNLRNVQILKSS